MRILIAEDDKISRDLLRLILASEQRHTLLEASDGEEALRMLRDPASGRIDLCILDIMMPRMDGLSLVEQMRQVESLKSMRVILCTALSDRAKVQRAVQLGVLHYIVKPYVRSLILEKTRMVESELAAEESLESQNAVCERLGIDSETCNRLLREFLDEVRPWLAYIRTCDIAGEHEQIAITVNGFRGTALTLGTAGLARALGDIEPWLAAPPDEKARAALNLGFNAIDNEVKMVLGLAKERLRQEA